MNFTHSEKNYNPSSNNYRHSLQIQYLLGIKDHAELGYVWCEILEKDFKNAYYEKSFVDAFVLTVNSRLKNNKYSEGNALLQIFNQTFEKRNLFFLTYKVIASAILEWYQEFNVNSIQNGNNEADNIDCMLLQQTLETLLSSLVKLSVKNSHVATEFFRRLKKHTANKNIDEINEMFKDIICPYFFDAVSELTKNYQGTHPEDILEEFPSEWKITTQNLAQNSSTRDIVNIWHVSFLNWVARKLHYPAKINPIELHAGIIMCKLYPNVDTKWWKEICLAYGWSSAEKLVFAKVDFGFCSRCYSGNTSNFENEMSQKIEEKKKETAALLKIMRTDINSFVNNLKQIKIASKDDLKKKLELRRKYLIKIFTEINQIITKMSSADPKINLSGES